MFAHANQEFDRDKTHRDEDRKSKIEHISELKPEHEIAISAKPQCFAYQYCRLCRRVIGEPPVNKVSNGQEQSAGSERD